MALVRCSDCGNEISDAAPACIHCGRPAEGKTPPARATPQKKPLGCAHMIFGGIVLLFIALVLSEGFSGSDDWTGTAGSGPPRLSALVRFSPTQVSIRNDDAQTWTNCSMELNGQWERNNETIGSTESVMWQLSSFTRSNGERFNPLTHSVQRLDIHCTVGGERRHWNGRN